MRNYVVLGINLAIIVFVVGTMLSGHPLWKQGAGVAVVATGALAHAQK